MKCFIPLIVLAACSEGIGVSDTHREIDMVTPWTSHVVLAGDASASRKGADGHAWGDFDGDSAPDLAVVWEESNNVSVTTASGTVLLPSSGSIVAPEDVAVADVDGDTYQDLIIACDGGARIVLLFGAGTPLTASSWTRVDPTASVGKRWLKVAWTDFGGGSIVAAGGKEATGVSASAGMFSSSTPRTASSWTYTKITDAGWIMSLEPRDMDGDSDKDLLVSDRQKITVPLTDYSHTGIRWYENGNSWAKHDVETLGGQKFLHVVDWDGDGDEDLATCRSSATYNESPIYLRSGSTWTKLTVAQPTGVGQCQDVKAVDVDQDGTLDLSFTYSVADGALSGLVWYRNTGTPTSPTWTRGEISGEPGVKYDLLEWRDMDADGDLDALSTEQSEDTDYPTTPTTQPGIGAVWYENPLDPMGGTPDAGCGS